uniref:Uncharacterized protein n=1 Tax=Inoviridae sp. ctNqM18 TaxID=2825780 RepID=A0A8S5U202_9VIRU|nr:MAG TPA: hypothetical protein [Inoviridae sp. ctNqM18]
MLFFPLQHIIFYFYPQFCGHLLTISPLQHISSPLQHIKIPPYSW